MERKLSPIQIGVAGEYFVAAELSRRGYVASLTLRNTRGIDILASNADASRSVGIQVKTSGRNRRRWMLSKKAEKDLAENLFYVLVLLGQDTLLPEFYIVPRAEVAKYVRESHAEWLRTPGKKGQEHRDTNVRQFDDPKGKFKDRWDLLGLD